MEDKRQVVCLSLPKKSLLLLDRISRKEEKNRSEVVRELIKKYLIEKDWEEIFSWGIKTAKNLHLKTEEDILKLIND